MNGSDRAADEPGGIIRLLVKPGDSNVTSNPRVQLESAKGTPACLTDGKEFWFKFGIRTNTGEFPMSNLTWCSMIAFYGKPYGGSGGLQFVFRGSPSGHLLSTGPATENYSVHWQSQPWKMDAWNDFVVHGVAGKTKATSWIEVFEGSVSSGRIQTVLLSPGVNDGEPNNLRCGIYHESGHPNTDMIARYRGIAVGPTRASVGG